MAGVASSFYFIERSPKQSLAALEDLVRPHEQRGEADQLNQDRNPNQHRINVVRRLNGDLIAGGYSAHGVSPAFISDRLQLRLHFVARADFADAGAFEATGG